jgi:hypothetical protein
METFTKEQFWDALEGIGEEEVRVRIATQLYGPNSDKRRLAEEWLRKKDQERKDASNAASLRIARSAKNAAWAAAIAAMIAAICAVIAYLSMKDGEGVTGTDAYWKALQLEDRINGLERKASDLERQDNSMVNEIVRLGNEMSEPR